MSQIMRYGNKDELSTTIKVMSRCLSASDATNLHLCLKNKQVKMICIQCSGSDITFMVDESSFLVFELFN